MIVKNNIAKLNNNNCKNIISNMNNGIDVIDAFKLEFKKNAINFNHIKGIEIRNDKYYWIFSLLKLEI